MQILGQQQNRGFDLDSFTRLAAAQLNTGQIVSDVMTSLTREHVRRRFPESKHWDTNKITPVLPHGNTGGVNIDIPGAGRAEHDVIIRPIHGQYLTIPLVNWAIGRKASDFPDLFRPWKKGGGERANILAQKATGGSLTAVFALAKQAFQRQDSTLLPTREEYDTAIFDEWTRRLASKMAEMYGGNIA